MQIHVPLDRMVPEDASMGFARAILGIFNDGEHAAAAQLCVILTHPLGLEEPIKEALLNLAEACIPLFEAAGYTPSEITRAAKPLLLKAIEVLPGVVATHRERQARYDGDVMAIVEARGIEPAELPDDFLTAKGWSFGGGEMQARARKIDHIHTALNEWERENNTIDREESSLSNGDGPAGYEEVSMRADGSIISAPLDPPEHKPSTGAPIPSQGGAPVEAVAT